MAGRIELIVDVNQARAIKAIMALPTAADKAGAGMKKNLTKHGKGAADNMIKSFVGLGAGIISVAGIAAAFKSAFAEAEQIATAASQRITERLAGMRGFAELAANDPEKYADLNAKAYALTQTGVSYSVTAPFVYKLDQMGLSNNPQEWASLLQAYGSEAVNLVEGSGKLSGIFGPKAGNAKQVLGQVLSAAKDAQASPTQFMPAILQSAGTAFAQNWEFDKYLGVNAALTKVTGSVERIEPLMTAALKMQKREGLGEVPLGDPGPRRLTKKEIQGIEDREWHLDQLREKRDQLLEAQEKAGGSGPVLSPAQRRDLEKGTWSGGRLARGRYGNLWEWTQETELGGGQMIEDLLAMSAKKRGTLGEGIRETAFLNALPTVKTHLEQVMSTIKGGKARGVGVADDVLRILLQDPDFRAKMYEDVSERKQEERDRAEGTRESLQDQARTNAETADRGRGKASQWARRQVYRGYDWLSDDPALIDAASKAPWTEAARDIFGPLHMNYGRRSLANPNPEMMGDRPLSDSTLLIQEMKNAIKEQTEVLKGIQGNTKDTVTKIEKLELGLGS